MVEVIISILFGVTMHRTHHILEAWQRAGTGSAWVNLSRMAIGVVSVLPVYIIIRGHKGDQMKQDIGAYLTAFSTFGIGVAIGYLLDER